MTFENNQEIMELTMKTACMKWEWVLIICTDRKI